ncbi:unnamed protein product [Prorocentrum cordatum]|uniref:Protein kinase domain-containing protein n=1 Tax=Prorocentrum cordatum TaxID=2364126 RepID=A0ABN9VYB3_9DINO|nr:unnamed protein product [Polarella glacialis]
MDVLRSGAACSAHRGGGACEHAQLLRSLLVHQVPRLNRRFQSRHGRRHGDFKADNVLIDRSGIPRLADFLSPFCQSCDREELLCSICSSHPAVQEMKSAVGGAWSGRSAADEAWLGRPGAALEPGEACGNARLLADLERLVAAGQSQSIFGPMPSLLSTVVGRQVPWESAALGSASPTPPGPARGAAVVPRLGAAVPPELLLPGRLGEGLAPPPGEPQLSPTGSKAGSSLVLPMMSLGEMSPLGSPTFAASFFGKTSFAFTARPPPSKGQGPPEPPASPPVPAATLRPAECQVLTQCQATHPSPCQAALPAQAGPAPGGPAPGCAHGAASQDTCQGFHAGPPAACSARPHTAASAPCHGASPRLSPGGPAGMAAGLTPFASIPEFGAGPLQPSPVPLAAGHGAQLASGTAEPLRPPRPSAAPQCCPAALGGASTAGGGGGGGPALLGGSLGFGDVAAAGLGGGLNIPARQRSGSTPLPAAGGLPPHLALLPAAAVPPHGAAEPASAVPPPAGAPLLPAGALPPHGQALPAGGPSPASCPARACSSLSAPPGEALLAAAWRPAGCQSAPAAPCLGCGSAAGASFGLAGCGGGSSSSSSAAARFGFAAGCGGCTGDLCVTSTPVTSNALGGGACGFGLAGCGGCAGDFCVTSTPVTATALGGGVGAAGVGLAGCGGCEGDLRVTSTPVTSIALGSGGTAGFGLAGCGGCVGDLRVASNANDFFGCNGCSGYTMPGAEFGLSSPTYVGGPSAHLVAQAATATARH